nr:Rap1a/Tai family immunity protein [uncultured Rhodopila sp.]
MKRSLALAVLASGAVFAGAQAAQPVSLSANTAGQLAELCTAPPLKPGADAKVNFCRGFAQGAITVELAHAGDKKPFCFPAPAPSRAKTMSQFAAWVKAAPDRAASPSTEALFRFLGEQYPCK